VRAVEAAADGAETLVADTVTIPVLANDSDPAQGGLTLELPSNETPVGATVDTDGTGTRVIYTPVRNWNGIDTFTYTITDRFGRTDTGTVRVELVPLQDPPVANDDGYPNVPYDLTVVLPVLNNDTDPDGDPLRITNVLPPSQGDATWTDTTITYDPPSNFNEGDGGTVSIWYWFTDGRWTVYAKAIVTVLPNRPPQIISVTRDPFSGDVNVGRAVTLEAKAVDPFEQDPLTYMWEQISPAGPLVIDPGTEGSIVHFVAPSLRYGEMFTFRVTVSDPYNSVTAPISVLVNRGRDYVEPVGAGSAKAPSSAGAYAFPMAETAGYGTEIPSSSQTDPQPDNDMRALEVGFVPEGAAIQDGLTEVEVVAMQVYAVPDEVAIQDAPVNLPQSTVRAAKLGSGNVKGVSPLAQRPTGFGLAALGEKGSVRKCYDDFVAKVKDNNHETMGVIETEGRGGLGQRGAPQGRPRGATVRAGHPADRPALEARQLARRQVPRPSARPLRRPWPDAPARQALEVGL